ncbi:MAG TPA: kelch repeat-containing protein, partial [Blastocatellia bacterium]|nr:kelch repeat-containing protein [Blastocatellia bacterium]
MKKMMFAKKTLLILFLILLMNCDGQTAFAQSRTWVATGSIVTGRYHHTATLLSDGKVLVVGGYSRCSFATGCATLDSAELYNPVTGTWSAAGRLRSARSAHLAVRLPGGKVLVAGGGATPVTAELYDPATGAWTPTGNLNFGRFDAVGMLLPNGKVLVAGGATLNNNGSVSVLNSAELYDPATGVWTLTGNLNIPRLFASATLLTNGKVLLAGGESNLAASNVVRSAELYDLATGAWTLTGSLNAARQTHPAVLLQNGKVLVTSGFVGNTLVTSAELYDPVAGAWSLTGSSGNSRETATLLPNGQVLATGADGGEISTEIYNPATGLWRADANLTTKRNSHTATLLQTGKVLIVGGTADG